MLQTARQFQRKHPQTGFSLVEIMVGMVIGMLGIIVIMQVFSLFEGQKRTTTGSSDVQNEGAITLYSLQRDIQQAGYGTSSLNMIGCGLTLRAGVTLGAIAPVAINSADVAAGQDANTDTLLVMYSNTNGGTEGDNITSQPANNIYAVATPTAHVVNDLVVAEPQTRPTPTCTLALDSVTAVASPNVTVATGTAGVANGTLYNLGQSLTIRAYAVRNSTLTMCDYTANNCADATQVNNSAVWSPIAGNIVSLRAQYGQDTSGPPMDGIVDVYNQTTPATACNWVRTAAIRLALVGRNAQLEKTAVTTAAPTWLGSATSPINLTANASWQSYRYKVFQTVVPIRNITTMGAQAGC